MILALVAILAGGKKIVRVPRIGHVADMVIGLTGVHDFEHRHKRGLIHIGGHSNSGHTWYDLTSGAEIDIDGFNYWDRGLIIDGIGVTWQDVGQESSKVPRIRIKRSKSGILALLHKGMSIKEVEAALGMKLDSKSEIHAKGLIQYSSHVVNKQTDRYTHWDASFDFSDHGLIGFGVSAD